MASRTKSRGAAGRSKATPKKTERVPLRARIVRTLRTGRERIQERLTRQSDDVWGVALLVLAGVGLFLQRSRSGTAMRAVSDDADLAESSGIDVNRIILITWMLAGGLAALGGIFFGLNEAVQWDMGFRLLLLIFAAVVLGGLGTAYGAMVGGFVVGIAVEMSTLFMPNELKTAVGLVVLIVILLVKPQGLFGTRERIG